MHVNRPKFGIHSVVFALLVMLPTAIALSDDPAAPGVIRLTDGSATPVPAPIPVPVPVPVSPAPAAIGPRALDMGAAGHLGVRRGPYVGGQVPVPTITPYPDSPYDATCEDCESDCEDSDSGIKSLGTRWWHNQRAMYHARNRYNNDQLKQAVRGCLTDGRSHQCKYGYFIPTGCGGGGCPPVGFYSMVYPLNPHFVDRRDTGIYAAQGYGVPVTVPLAPTVENAYNYSWGIPSSRLTPISRTVR